jgi:hypothetical protein
LDDQRQRDEQRIERTRAAASRQKEQPEVAQETAALLDDDQ